MKNLYIDFDGVVLDTITVSYELLEQASINKDDVERIREFYKKLDWQKILEETPIINDSINGIKKIIDSSKYDVSILTHVLSLEEAEEKIKFIRKYLPSITIIPCPRNIKKSDIVNAKDAILIDDYSGNLNEWKASGGIPIRFSVTMDDKGFICIDKLEKILDLKIY